MKTIIMLTMLLCHETLLAQFSTDEVTSYDRNGEKMFCLYHFVVQKPDGWTSYFSSHLYGTMQYTYTKGTHTSYVIDYKIGLDLLPNLDRTINPDIDLSVDPSNCKENK